MSDRYRGRRPSPDGRERYPTADTYVPNSARGSRPRSRSPGNFRRRSRTPPRRFDDRDASYNRDRPPRARSPPPARDGDRPRSPARRTFSPSRSYRPRSRSPVRRDDRPDPYAVKSWRRRSPSPRSARGDGSGRESGANSRRVSPRPFNRQPSDAYDDARAPLRQRSPPPPRSPPRRRDSPPPPRPRSPIEEDPYEARARMSSDRGYPTNGDGYGNGRDNESYPPNDYRERAPPSGPYTRAPAGQSGLTPPSGPSSSTPVSMSAHNRPDSAGGYGPAPSRGGYRGRGGPPPRDFSREFSGRPRRGSYGGGAPYAGRGDPYPPRDPYYDSRPPPRARDAPYPPPGFRGSSNSTSTTYPRTQRFNQHLADLPSIKDGGEHLPPLHDPTKADRLEEEAARLRKMIDEKEARKRQGLREWDRMERESSTAALRSELAEDHLRTLNGETDGTNTAF